jgi:hypothetical protein
MDLSESKNSDIASLKNMRRSIVINVKKPMFFAKKGHFGERGYTRVSLTKWIWMQSTFVTKVRWIKCSLFKK